MNLCSSGELVGTCEGPHGSTVPVSIEHLGPDTTQCVLTPRSAGPHSLSLLYGGFPLPSSPYHGLAETGGSGVRVVLTGKGLASATCGQPAEFTIDGSQAGPGNRQFLFPKSEFLSSKSEFLSSKSEFLLSKLVVLLPKSEFFTYS